MKDFSLEVHGLREFEATGAISQPIHLSATFRHPAFRRSTGYDYSRVANPTRYELEKTVTALERGGRTWATSSGMAAINLVLSLFNPGDQLLFLEDLYGGTVRLANEVYRKYGIESDYVDTTDLTKVRAAMKPNTKAIFIETPSNPMMLISDIKALAEIAHEYGAILIVDNTFLSPHFQKPLKLGADIVVHSATKYLSGHNDVIAGFVTIKDAESDAAKELELLAKSAGPTLAPMDSWLLLRSIKTLGLRVERQAQNALKIAEWLQTQPRVTNVYYPGLPGSAGYRLQKTQATGDGGMVSFKVNSAKLAQDILGRLKLICFAESLGGVESLLTYPVVQTHAEMPQELMERTGLDDTLLRLSVGIEDVEDLIADLEQAINA